MTLLNPKTNPGRYRVDKLPESCIEQMKGLSWAINGMYGELRNGLGTFIVFGDTAPLVLPYGTELSEFTGINDLEYTAQ
jgi:hypothetical protein